MGLLDGLLGQVLGGMAQQGRGASAGPDLSDLLRQMGGGAGTGMPSGRGGGLEGLGMGGGGPLGGMGGAAGAGGMGALIAIALQMLQQNGGLENILGRMQQQGHGNEANSWVQNGDNLPISPDILSQILGREELGRAAQQYGMQPEEAAGGLASIFPDIVNQMTPQGRIEAGTNDVVAQALEILRQQGKG